MDYLERTYAQRIELEDGAHLDIGACARSDAQGLVVSYYYTSAAFAQNYNLTIQNLLKGYSKKSDGTILISDQGKLLRVMIDYCFMLRQRTMKSFNY